MNHDHDLLNQALESLLADLATPQASRRALATRRPDAKAWEALVDGGYLQVLVPESLGGADLDWSAMGALAQAAGRHLPVAPVAEAALAHALAARCGVALPPGIVTVSSGLRDEWQGWSATAVPWGDAAQGVVLWQGRHLACVAATGAAMVEHAGPAGSSEADGQWPADAVQGQGELSPGCDADLALAAMRCAQMAGALEAVLALTLRHAQDRRQFGRPIGQFQAIGQQVAVLAEDVFAARMAAALACRGEWPVATDVAAAQVVTSEAAARACGIAHAVHGAMGVTAEHDLHLHTRRLLAWRLQQGSEVHWAQRLGQALWLDRRPVWDAVREGLDAV